MKLNENELRKIIRTILEGSLIGANPLLKYNDISDIKVNVHVLKPAYTNATSYFKTPELQKMYGNGTEVVEQTFDQIMELFMDELENDYVYTFAGSHDDPFVVVFEDETFNSAGKKNVDFNLKKTITEIIPSSFVYQVNNANLGLFKYNDNISLKSASKFDIEKYNLQDQLNYFIEHKNECLLRERTTFSITMYQNLTIDEAIQQFIPTEYQKFAYEEIAEGFKQYQKFNRTHGINENSLPTFRGVAGTIYRSHGDYNDPEIEADGYIANYYDVEDTLYEDCKEECGQDFADNDEQFNKYCQDHADYVIYLIKEFGKPIEQDEDIF